MLCRVLCLCLFSPVKKLYWTIKTIVPSPPKWMVCMYESSCNTFRYYPFGGSCFLLTLVCRYCNVIDEFKNEEEEINNRNSPTYCNSPTNWGREKEGDPSKRGSNKYRIIVSSTCWMPVHAWGPALANVFRPLIEVGPTTHLPKLPSSLVTDTL